MTGAGCHSTTASLELGGSDRGARSAARMTSATNTELLYASTGSSQGGSMFRVDADKPVHFCDGLTPPRLPARRGPRAARPALPSLRGAEGGGPRCDRTRDVNCIMLFLVGGPSQHRHLGPEARRARRGSAGPFQPIADQRPGHPDQRDLPADGQARGQVLAGPLGLPHRHRRPRHRPPDDADRPAVHRRHRAPARRLRRWATSRAAAATLPPHVLLPRPIGRTGGNLPHGQTAGYLGKPYDPFILNADPNDAGLQGARPAAAGLHLGASAPTPAAATARRGRRRRSARSRTARRARQLDDNFELAYR